MRYLNLAACILLVAILSMGCRGNKSKLPPVHPNQNMDFAQSYEAQERNDWFPNHAAMRPRIEGTVSRDFHAVSTEKARIGQKVPSSHLRNDPAYFTGLTADGLKFASDPAKITNTMTIANLPDSVKLTPQLVARGEERYKIFCTPCHALDGSGQGTVPERAGPSYNVPSYHGPTTEYPDKDIREHNLGLIFHIISHGRGVMGAYNTQIPTADRWAIAVWVRTLQISQSAKLADVPAKVRSDKGWN